MQSEPHPRKSDDEYKIARIPRGPSRPGYLPWRFWHIVNMLIAATLLQKGVHTNAWKFPHYSTSSAHDLLLLPLTWNSKYYAICKIWGGNPAVKSEDHQNKHPLLSSVSFLIRLMEGPDIPEAKKHVLDCFIPPSKGDPRHPPIKKHVLGLSGFFIPSTGDPRRPPIKKHALGLSGCFYSINGGFKTSPNKETCSLAVMVFLSMHHQRGAQDIPQRNIVMFFVPAKGGPKTSPRIKKHVLGLSYVFNPPSKGDKTSKGSQFNPFPHTHEHRATTVWPESSLGFRAQAGVRLRGLVCGREGDQPRLCRQKTKGCRSGPADRFQG